MYTNSSFRKNIPPLSATVLAILLSILMVGITAKNSYLYAKEIKKNKALNFAPPSAPAFKGLYACNPGIDQQFPTAGSVATPQYYWGSTDIDGVVERMSWAGLDTARNGGHGKYNFAVLDTECRRAIRSGNKGITLDIYGGAYAPAWLYKTPYISGTDYLRFYIKQANGPDSCANIPIPWSASYIATWDTFIHRLGKHLASSFYIYSGSTHYYLSVIKILKIGACCTNYTSELRVPGDSCQHSSEGDCCPRTDSIIWAGTGSYSVSNLKKSIDTMADNAERAFPGVIIAIPVIAGGRAFPSPTGCTPPESYSDCISQGIVFHVVSKVVDTNLVMGMYESLNIDTTDGSICRMLTGVYDTTGLIKSSHCLFGYQLNAKYFGGPLSGSIDCGNMGDALTNGNTSHDHTKRATYFEVFQRDFKTSPTDCETVIGEFHSVLSSE